MPEHRTSASTAAELEAASEEIRRAAEALIGRARYLEVAGAIGLGATSAAGAYVTDRLLSSLAKMSAWNQATPPTPWPPVAAFVLGGLVGWALAKPFADWLRLQARLAEVHLRSEASMRKAGEHTEETARGIRALGTATATFASIELPRGRSDDEDQLGPLKGSR